MLLFVLYWQNVLLDELLEGMERILQDIVLSLLLDMCSVLVSVCVALLVY